VQFRHRLEVGSPLKVVADFVSRHNVDLLVAEEPPRSALATALWRGLAERLIRAVDCPVVVGGPGFQRGEPRREAQVYEPLGAATTGDLLNAMVDARVEALRSWLDHCSHMARRIAESKTVVDAASLATRHRGMVVARIEQRLQVELNEHRQAHRALGWRLSTPARTWESHEFVLDATPALDDFLHRVQAHGSSASIPIPLACDRLAILAGARVRTSQDEDGLLILVFDAQDHFLRILGQPGPLPSFETYAFDEAGLMLSNSRFPAALVASGLLSETGSQTPLLVRVAEPSTGPVETWPLTRMAADATSHRDGHDVSGYLDYRGMPVVGAWRWLPEYGFGVTAEIDDDVSG